MLLALDAAVVPEGSDVDFAPLADDLCRLSVSCPKHRSVPCLFLNSFFLLPRLDLLQTQGVVRLADVGHHSLEDIDTWDTGNVVFGLVEAVHSDRNRIILRSPKSQRLAFHSIH